MGSRLGVGLGVTGEIGAGVRAGVRDMVALAPPERVTVAAEPWYMVTWVMARVRLDFRVRARDGLRLGKPLG